VRQQQRLGAETRSRVGRLATGMPAGFVKPADVSRETFAGAAAAGRRNPWRFSKQVLTLY
jgi:hypothetical protein